MKSKPKNKSDKPAATINQQQSQQQYQLLKDLMDCIPDVIYFKDRKGRFLLVNKAHARGLGMPAEKVVGKTDFDIHPKERAKLMVKDDEYVMSTGKTIIDKVERSTRADGIDNFVSTTKIPRYDEEGRIIGLVGITRDITHRMQLESLRGERKEFKKKLSALEEINRMKTEFISIVSHELKTPLAIVKEGVSLILDGIKGTVNEGQQKVLFSVQNNAERLRKLIDELLDVSRIEKGKLKLNYSLVNLNELIKDTSAYYKKLAQEKGLILNYNLPEQELNIFLDPERVTQVISNLIDNAIKFTEQGGSIEIEVKIIADTIRIGVIDTGVGIARRDIGKIFNKFMQVSSPMGGKNKGIGLGLSIIKELVVIHGGEIWAESRSGIGSRFYFTLPRLYTTSFLDKETRNKINEFLSRGTALFLINLLIINFQEFRKFVRVKSKTLTDDLMLVINKALRPFSRGKDGDTGIFLTDFHQGEIKVIYPGATEKQVVRLCGSFKERISAYFRQNKIKNIFINLGVADFPHREKPSEPHKVSADIHIRRIHIGAEKRRFARFAYKARVELLAAGNKIETAQTIDISAGGLCFMARQKMKTGSRISVKLSLPDKKEPLSLAGRIACVKETAELSDDGKRRGYKSGLEFVDLKKQDKEAISKFIRRLRLK